MMTSSRRSCTDRRAKPAEPRRCVHCGAPESAGVTPCSGYTREHAWTEGSVERPAGEEDAKLPADATHKPWCKKVRCAAGDEDGEAHIAVCVQRCTCERRARLTSRSRRPRRSRQRRVSERRVLSTPAALLREWKKDERISPRRQPGTKEGRDV